MPTAVLILLLMFPIYLWAQPDSLQKAIDSATDPDKKLSLLLKQADALKNANPYGSFRAAQEASPLINNKKDLRLLAEAEFLIQLFSGCGSQIVHFGLKKLL